MERVFAHLLDLVPPPLTSKDILNTTSYSSLFSPIVFQSFLRIQTLQISPPQPHWQDFRYNTSFTIMGCCNSSLFALKISLVLVIFIFVQPTLINVCSNIFYAKSGWVQLHRIFLFSILSTCSFRTEVLMTNCFSPPCSKKGAFKHHITKSHQMF